MKPHIKAYDVALGGIAAALEVVFVMLAVYVEPLTLTFYVCSSIAVMIPLTKGSYKASILSFVASGILVMVIANIQALPYLIFFGPHAIFMCVCKHKNVKKYISYPIKLALFNVVLYVLYSVLGMIVIDFDKLGFHVAYVVIALVGSGIFVLYDYMLLKVYEVLGYYMDKWLKLR